MGSNGEGRERLQRLERVVAAMESPMREVFLMHRLECLGYDEIGARLGLSAAEVERGIAGAMLHLARGLDKAERGDGTG